MHKRTLAALLTVATMAALLVGSQGASAQQAFTPVTETLSIDTEFGKIYVEVTYPTKNDKPVRGPAVVTLSPYSVLGRENVAYSWVPEGYVHVWADVIGTGNSGGCYDYGGEREKKTGYELVEWIAKQPWSNGKVGMIGGSYNGTTQWATAVMQPPHLTTIIPEAAIDRWYDYAYSGGVRYNLNNENPTDEGLDTPLGFDFGFAIPPPVDVADPSWADKVASTVVPCDEIAHTEHGYDDTPDYDDFWLERDYLKDAGKIDIPVLIAANWGDYNVKQENSWNMYQALKKSNSAKTSLYMGTRWSGHGTPGGEYGSVVRQWFDHYLRGIDNGVQKLAPVTSAVADYDGTLEKEYAGKEPKTDKVTLYAQESIPTFDGDYGWKLLPDPWHQTFLAPTIASWPIDAPNAETHANHHPRNNHEWWFFESPALRKDTRVFGQIEVQLYSKVYRTWVTLAPVILDIKHECHQSVANQHVPTPECTTQSAPGTNTPRPVVSVTRGFLDSRYRNGLDKQVPVEPGKSFAANILMKPIDYVFRKHHSIALNVFTNNTEWMLPKGILPTDVDATCAVNNVGAAAADCAKITLDWASNKVRVVIPIVNAPKDSYDLFDFGHQH